MIYLRSKNSSNQINKKMKKIIVIRIILGLLGVISGVVMLIGFGLDPTGMSSLVLGLTSLCSKVFAVTLVLPMAAIFFDLASPVRMSFNSTDTIFGVIAGMIGLLFVFSAGILLSLNTLTSAVTPSHFITAFIYSIFCGGVVMVMMKTKIVGIAD